MSEFIKKRDWLSQWGVPFTLISIASIFLLIFYIDYNLKGSSQAKGEVVGNIIYKNNIVQRKGKHQRIWSQLISSSPLYDRDIIRADRLSNARINLKDGTRIQVDENSMFRLEFSGRQAELSFERGSIRIEQDRKGASGLVVKSGGKEIELSKSSVQIEVSGSGKKSTENLNLFVESGQAKIGKYLVGNQQRAQLGRKGTVIKDIPVVLKKPADQKIHSISTNQTAVIFAWQVKKRLKNLKLEISYSRDFSNILRTVSVKKGRAKVNFSSPRKGLDLYYWRIRGKNRSKKWVSSTIYSFSVVRKDTFKVYSPDDNKVIRYISKLPNVRFSWSRIKLANEYILDISSNKSFDKKNSKSYQIDVSSFHLELPAGEYYWRLRAPSKIKDILSTKSKIYSFRILHQKNASFSPVLEKPAEIQNIDQESITKTGILFKWDAVFEISEFNLQISKNQNFNKVFSQKRIKNEHFLNFREILEPGLYYWRVASLNLNDESLSYSNIRKFYIHKKEKIEDLSNTPGKNWKAPTVDVPEDVRNFSLAQCRELIKNLNYNCNQSGLPGILIKKCYINHVTVNLKGWYRKFLYNFLKLEGENYQYRLHAYAYFRENCYFKPVQEWGINILGTKIYNIKSSEEKEKILKMNEAMQNCPNSNSSSTPVPAPSSSPKPPASQ